MKFLPVSLFKAWIKSEPAHQLFGYVIAFYWWLLLPLARWQRHVAAETQTLIDARDAMIICTWHGRMFFLAGGWPKRPPKFGVLASQHRDGRLIARAVEAMGYDTALGSSRRGGASGLRAVSRLVRQGVPMVITPDGPRGPRMRVKLGAIKAAQMTGAPLVPFSGSTRPRKVFNSWDRFCLPLLFSRAVVYWDAPLYIPREADDTALERYRALLEERLIALTNQAERDLDQEETQAADPEEGARDHARP